MSRVEVDKIQQQCGSTLTVGGGASKTVTVDATTVTLGRCGGTVSLASGATQSGFGRTGTVDWQTGDIKTATFTAVSGKGYFCNTAGGAFEVDLPAGSAGDIVSIQDYNNTFDDNNLTVDPNGSEKINGGTAGGFVTLSTEGEGITLVYVDSTVGWRAIQDNVFADPGTIPLFVTASGGTETTVCTNYKVHTFTGPGTFTVSCAGNSAGSNLVSYMVVAGGAGGGDGSGGSSASGGGGGAGGFREGRNSFCSSYTDSPLNAPAGLPVPATGYPIVIGAGGGTNACGNAASFSTITSAGGGKGGNGSGSPVAGTAGGSGGGGNGSGGGGGAGNTPPVSPPQGQNGAPSPGGGGGGAGGGGATAVGTTAPGGAGGAGATTHIPSSPITKAAGGTGAGPGGGGCAGSPQPANSGNGAQGGKYPGAAGGTGGSGIVVIRYRFQ